MDESQDPTAAESIAGALTRLRRPGGQRGPGGPWANPGWGPPGFGPPHLGDHHHGAGHGRHGAGPGGGPWRGGDHGPLGRLAARMRLLEALSEAEAPLSVSEIAERIGVDQPRASRLVQAAVATGHARREVDADDARRTNVVLTDEGRAIVARTSDARRSAVDTALEGFSETERQQLAALLTRFAEAWPR